MRVDSAHRALLPYRMTLESEGKRPARHSVWRAHLRDRDSAYERTTRLGASLSHRAVPSRHGGMFGLRRLQEVRRPHVVGLSMRPHPVRSPDPASVTHAAPCTRPPSSYAAVRLGWVVPSQLSPLLTGASKQSVGLSAQRTYMACVDTSPSPS